MGSMEQKKKIKYLDNKKMILENNNLEYHYKRPLIKKQMESKKKFETLALKQILDKVVNQKQLKRGLQNIRVCNSWEEVMGKNIFSYTDQVRYSNNILYIKIKSAPLKMELKFNLDLIKDKLNEHLEKSLIKKVVVY